jgi:hypothetical protein
MAILLPSLKVLCFFLAVIKGVLKLYFVLATFLHKNISDSIGCSSERKDSVVLLQYLL